ncbi:MAG: exodeoxyribonuclease VII small subunit [Bacteroidota bacterium]
MKKSTKNNFESQLNRLQEIVEQLEGGEISLDESLQLFEEAIKISSESYDYLNNAELKVKQLIKSQTGKFDLSKFE